MSKALEVNKARLRQAFASLSSPEIETLTALLQRVREGFATTALEPDKSIQREPTTSCGSDKRSAFRHRTAQAR